ncbi:hypothetical protein [Streptomyces sp. NPDC058653]|uniref:hypothetical protein n=1 Tax=Streptomyces sp. NPDC058653 TaxID=3346576 RepID=UPI003649370C
MTTELTEAQRQLADAQKEKAELDGLIQGLEKQVLAGEAEETERELTEQYGLARLAKLRQEAAERRVKDAAAAEVQERRQAALVAARKELERLAPERLAEACEAALEAIERVQQLGDARQAAVERHAAVFLDLGMSGRILHQDSSWVVFEVDGVRYDTRQDSLDGRRLLAVIEGERVRRAQIPGRLAKGFTPPAPEAHPVAQLLAAQTAGGAGL